MADAICGRSPTEIAVIARSVRPGTCPILEWNETPDAAHGERDQSRPELDCRLGEMPAEDWRLSDNLVARLNLPNMRSPAGRRVDMYAQAVRGLLDLEPDGDKREKYLEFIDIYAGLTENEFRRYRQQHPEESTMAGLIQKARDEGMRRGMREILGRGMERGMEHDGRHPKGPRRGGMRARHGAAWSRACGRASRSRRRGARRPGKTDQAPIRSAGTRHRRKAEAGIRRRT